MRVRVLREHRLLARYLRLRAQEISSSLRRELREFRALLQSLTYIELGASLGRFGELVAARYLEKRRLLVLEQNWSSEIGELDIIAKSGSTLIILEVKTRRHKPRSLLTPIDAIDYAKQRKIKLLAARYAAQLERRRETRSIRTIRFDSIGITVKRKRWSPLLSVQIEHIPEAFF